MGGVPSSPVTFQLRLIKIDMALQPLLVLSQPGYEQDPWQVRASGGGDDERRRACTEFPAA